MCLELLLLFLKLSLELGVDLLKMHVLRPLIIKASSQGSKFLAVTGKGLQFFCLFLGVGDHTLHKKGNPAKQLERVTGRKVFRSYHGKVMRLLEVLYIAIGQQQVTRQVGDDGILTTWPGQQQLNGPPEGSLGFFSSRLLGTYKHKYSQHTACGSR
jgi:hypothetical protein